MSSVARLFRGEDIGIIFLKPEACMEIPLFFNIEQIFHTQGIIFSSGINTFYK